MIDYLIFDKKESINEIYFESYEFSYLEGFFKNFSEFS